MSSSKSSSLRPIEILILDHSTNSLDIETENAIFLKIYSFQLILQMYLDLQLLDTIKRFDKFYVLKIDGEQY